MAHASPQRPYHEVGTLRPDLSCSDPWRSFSARSANCRPSIERVCYHAVFKHTCRHCPPQPLFDTIGSALHPSVPLGSTLPRSIPFSSHHRTPLYPAVHRLAPLALGTARLRTTISLKRILPTSRLDILATAPALRSALPCLSRSAPLCRAFPRTVALCPSRQCSTLFGIVSTPFQI